MKHSPSKLIYINSRLSPLLLARPRPLPWIFSVGEAWLLLTPPRLSLLAGRLGLKDRRIECLLKMVRRHAAEPETFCRPLGLECASRTVPRDYPYALCPVCDGVHYPHPEEEGDPCPECRAKQAREERLRPGGGAERDRREDRMARLVLRANDPGSFNGDTLSPNWRLNQCRRLQRDWDSAVNRIFMGGAYRQVAREFNCSVGLLHRKVAERKHWENN